MKFTTYRLRNQAELDTANLMSKAVWNERVKRWGVLAFESLTFDFVDAYKANITSPIFNVANENWLVYGDNQEYWVAIKFHESDLRKLNEKLFLQGKKFSDQGSPLELYLVRSFLKSFIEKLAASYLENQQNYEFKQALPQTASLKKGDGHLYSSFNYVGLDMSIFVSSGLIDKFTGSENRVEYNGPNHDIASWFGDKRINLTANINNLTIDLSTLDLLAVGDTLATTTKITEPVKIYVENEVVASGYLCQQSNQKSVQIIKS